MYGFHEDLQALRESHLGLLSTASEGRYNMLRYISGFCLNDILHIFSEACYRNFSFL